MTLLPCPFCGNVPTLLYGRNNEECWAYIACECGAQTRNFHGETDKAASALAAEMWNARAGTVTADASECADLLRECMTYIASMRNEKIISAKAYARMSERARKIWGCE